MAIVVPALADINIPPHVKVTTTDSFEEALRCLEHAFLALIATLCRQRCAHAQHGRKPGVVFACDRCVRRGRQPADRCRR